MIIGEIQWLKVWHMEVVRWIINKCLQLFLNISQLLIMTYTLYLVQK